MPGRNPVSIGDVIVEFSSRAEVVIARPAVVTCILFLMPVPLPALMALVGSAVVALVRNAVITLVGSVAMARIGVTRLVVVGSAMAVVVVIYGARPCRTGSEQ
jgi:hypothetical protein